MYQLFRRFSVLSFSENGEKQKERETYRNLQLLLRSVFKAVPVGFVGAYKGMPYELSIDENGQTSVSLAMFNSQAAEILQNSLESNGISSRIIEKHGDYIISIASLESKCKHFPELIGMFEQYNINPCGDVRAVLPDLSAF